MDDEVNKPEPGSEAAEREKAERAQRLEEGELSETEDLADVPLADTVRREVKAAERRQKGEPDPTSE